MKMSIWIKKPFCQFSSSPQRHENAFELAALLEQQLISFDKLNPLNSFWIVVTNFHLSWISVRFILFFFPSKLISVQPVHETFDVSHQSSSQLNKTAGLHASRCPQETTLATPRANRRARCLLGSFIVLSPMCWFSLVETVRGSGVRAMNQSLRLASPKATRRSASCRQMATWVTRTPTSRWNVPLSTRFLSPLLNIS